jgi:hypothetical protein
MTEFSSHLGQMTLPCAKNGTAKRQGGVFLRVKMYLVNQITKRFRNYYKWLRNAWITWQNSHNDEALYNVTYFALKPLKISNTSIMAILRKLAVNHERTRRKNALASISFK